MEGNQGTAKNPFGDILNKTPTDIKEALKMWRALADHVAYVKKMVAPHEDKMKELKSFIGSQLRIDDNQMKSETISEPGVATTYKSKKIGIKVTDWSAFQAYLTRNKMGAVMRHQANMAPLQDLYDMVMEGEAPSPKSAEFTTYETTTIRRI